MLCGKCKVIVTLNGFVMVFSQPVPAHIQSLVHTLIYHSGDPRSFFKSFRLASVYLYCNSRIRQRALVSKASLGPRFDDIGLCLGDCVACLVRNQHYMYFLIVIHTSCNLNDKVSIRLKSSFPHSETDSSATTGTQVLPVPEGKPSGTAPAVH